MIKGGYKIVNFNGAALSGTSETLPGIYDQIVDDYDKPIMVSGVSLNGDIMDDAYAGVQEKIAGDLSKSVELTVYGGIITVTEDDEVTFVLSKTTAELTAEVGDLDDLETTDKDSLVGAVNETKRQTVNPVKIATFQAPNTGSISADTAVSSSAMDISEAIPTGYKVVGSYCSDAGDDGFLITSVTLSDNNTKLTFVVRNAGTSAHSGAPKFALICIKE